MILGISYAVFQRGEVAHRGFGSGSPRSLTYTATPSNWGQSKNPLGFCAPFVVSTVALFSERWDALVLYAVSVMAESVAAGTYSSRGEMTR